MFEYDYNEAVKDDVLEWVKDNVNLSDYDTIEDLEEYLNDTLWTEDSVTGNASGSYTFSTYKAEEYICHNLDLLAEALKEFCCDVDVLEKGAECCDITIRCYLLSSAIADVLEELEDEFNACHAEKEAE